MTAPSMRYQRTVKGRRASNVRSRNILIDASMLATKIGECLIPSEVINITKGLVKMKPTDSLDR